MKDFSTQPNTTGAFPDVVADNASGPGETDGTPYNKQFIDDMWGARQSLMDKAGLTPSGTQESVDVSQFLEALQEIVKQSPLWISNWTDRTPAAGTNFRGIAFGAGLFVAVTQNNEIETSPDGVTWTTRTPVGVQPIYAISWSPSLSLFCAVGGTATPEIRTSPDGITWTVRTPAGAVPLRGLTWGNSLFVAVGASHIETSPDGINWTTRTPAATAGLDVEWSSTLSLFAVVGVSGNIETSPDGINWTSRAAAGATTFRAVAWGRDKFVAVGDSSTIETSPDGITWTARASAGGTIQFEGIVYANGQFVAVGGPSGGNVNGLEYSHDGINWTGQYTAVVGLQAIGYGIKRAVIASSAAVIRTSLYHG
jgi:hypothetical protein